MASRKVNEANELPMDVTIMGPLRPFSSDQVPRKQAVNIAGTVKAMFTKRMYWEALFSTISPVLQENLNFGDLFNHSVLPCKIARKIHTVVDQLYLKVR